MRDRETIDSELRRIASMRRSIREQGGQPSSRQVDELLDERLGHRAEASQTEAVKPPKTEIGAHTRRDLVETNDIKPRRRKAKLRRFGPLAALPLSLIAVAAVLVVMFAVHHRDPAAQPMEDPPSSAPPSPPPSPAAPKAPAPPVDIVESALTAALTQEGVPVPSHEYVRTQGLAVCDFLMHQPNFAEAVRFVQRSSIWDANQSADFTAGAVVSYCPQYEPTSADETQQTYQNALSDLQRIQGDLQGIRDHLPAIPGHQ